MTMKPYLFLILLFLIIQPLFSQNTLNLAGLNASTPSAVAFSLRKLSSNYSDALIKVRRTSDNAEATVAFDAIGGISATSMATFTPGVAVGTTLGTTQTGSISSDVSKAGAITIKVNKTGTINISNSSLSVTGTGTSFTTELVVGDRLFNSATNVFLGVVASITNNSTLLLTNFATLYTNSPLNFKTTSATVTGTGTNFTSELAAGDRIFNTGNIYLGTVATITNATALTLNANDALTATAINYKGTSATITGTGTNFTGLTVGDLLISNNITLGTIANITNSTSLTLTAKAGAAVSGNLYKSTTGTLLFSTFYAGTSVFVNTWYDQSGNNRNATQLKPANQPRIVNAGILYLVNGKISMEFSTTLTAFLQTSTAASYLNNTLYTLNKVTAEVTINPILQLPISTTGGNGPTNTISHYGYRSSSQFTVAQYNNDQNFNATPSTSLEQHTSVKNAATSSEFYKNGISLGVISGASSNLNNVGLLNIGFYTPSSSYYNGSVSELMVFSTALSSVDIKQLNDNQIAFFNIPSTYWTGAVSTDWADPANWSSGIVPTISSPSIVGIPAGKPFYPLISGVAQANSISLENATSLTVTGTLQLAGTLNNQGTCTASGGTIEYAGLAPQAINANTFAGNIVQNLIFKNSTGVLLNNNITVSGNLTFTSGNLSLNGSTLTLGGNVTNTVAGGLKGSINASLIISGSSSPTLSFDQTTPGTTNVLKNLTINSNGQIVTLANNLVLNNPGTTTFTAGKLAIGSNTLTLSGKVINTVANGISGSKTSNLIINGTVSPTLSFDQTTPGASNALNNFTINSTGQLPLLGSNLEVNGTMTFTAGKLAINDNTLNLKASVINTVAGGLSGSSGSNLIISGGTISPALSFDQTTPGTTNLLNNCTINSAGQAVRLINPLIIGGLLNLTDGLITTTNTNSLTLTTAAIFTGGSDLSFIDGPLVRNTNGTTIVQFPTGKINYYRPVSVTPVAAAPGVYWAEYFKTASPAGLNGAGVTAISTDEFWDVNRISGPDATITLLYSGNNTWSVGSPTSRDFIYVAHLNAGTWDPVFGSTIPGNTGSGNTQVTSKAMTAFSPFTFAYSSFAVLPVTLLEFKATKLTQANELQWRTAGEISLARYELQRSANSRNFYKIASVTATNSSGTKIYKWLDDTPLAGLNFYRLKILDLDGLYKYSMIVKIDRNGRKSMAVYPNPVSGDIILLQMYGQPKGVYTISLFNNNSIKVISNKIIHDGNDVVRTIKINNNLPNGIYYLEISDTENVKTSIKIFIK